VVKIICLAFSINKANRY